MKPILATVATPHVRRSAAIFDRFRHSRSGIAGIEFALVGGLLCVVLLNVVDVSIYLFSRMEVHNAAQVGAQAAVKTCDVAHLPATTACSGLNTAITAAIQSTSLGSAVTLPKGSPTEGYYCVNSSNALQFVGSVSAKPANCSAAGMASLQPGDYLLVTVNYPYAPAFGDFTVARFFSTPITYTGRARLL